MLKRLFIGDKKASIGSTLTWVAATFIIVFILAIYFMFMSASYIAKSKAGFFSIGTETSFNYGDSKLFMNRQFIQNLEKLGSIESQEYSTEDLILWLANYFDKNNMQYIEEDLVYSEYNNPLNKLDDFTKAVWVLVQTNLVGNKPFYECGGKICYPELIIQTSDKIFVKYTPGAPITKSEKKPINSEFGTYSIFLPFKNKALEVRISKATALESVHDRYYYTQYERINRRASSTGGSGGMIDIFSK